MKKVLLTIICSLQVYISTAQQFTWVNVQSNTQYNLHQLSFPNDSVGYIVADTVDFQPQGKVFRTFNRGIIWSQMNYTFYGLTTISAPSASTIYVSGSNGAYSVLRKSIDAGVTWLNMNLNCPLGPMEFYSNDKGFIATIDGGINKCFHTQNSGVSFDTAQIGLGPSALYDLEVVTDSVLYTGGLYGPKLSKTTQQSGGWNVLSNDYAITSLCFLNEDTGYMTAQYLPSSFDNLVHKTVDGGVTWLPLTGSTDPNGNGWTKIHCRNEQDCICVGGGGSLGVTDDGGLTWTFEPSGTTEILNDVYYGNSYAIAVGENGTIIRRVPVVTALGEEQEVNTFSIFPNPANNFTRLNGPFDQGDRITISDISGRIIYNDIHNGAEITHKIFAGNLQSGVYLVHIQGSENNTTLRLIRQ